MPDFSIKKKDVDPEKAKERAAEAFRIRNEREERMKKWAEIDANTVHFNSYSMVLEEGHLYVNGCDCSASIDEVEIAENMIKLIQKWIEAKK